MKSAFSIYDKTASMRHICWLLTFGEHDVVTPMHTFDWKNANVLSMYFSNKLAQQIYKQFFVWCNKIL
jgi:hypothetical protein